MSLATRTYRRATPFRIGETADGARVRVYEDGRAYVGRALVLPIETPLNRAMTLFVASPAMRQGDFPAAVELLPSIEARHESGEVGLPHAMLWAELGIGVASPR